MSKATPEVLTTLSQQLNHLRNDDAGRETLSSMTPESKFRISDTALLFMEIGKAKSSYSQGRVWELPWNGKDMTAPCHSDHSGERSLNHAPGLSL
jgi:hypothetical protein